MSINVTTRSGKGSPLTNTEMDTNLISLARSATTAQEGNVQLATDSEAIAGTLSSKAVTPAGLAATLAADSTPDYTTGGSDIGYYSLPGGITIQWGIYGMDGGASTQSVSFPTPFTEKVYSITMTNVEDYPNEGNVARIRTTSVSNFTFTNGGGNTYTAWYWMAIGK